MTTRYTFSKTEKLCLKKQINDLFSSGRWLRSEHLRIVYLTAEDEMQVPVQIMFSIPKKNHRRAVKRNLLKRRLREAYRLYKPVFYSSIESSNKKVLIAVVYSGTEIENFHTLQSELKYLLIQLGSRLSKV